MRFDDTLDTVLATDLATRFGAETAWRQLVDLIGRRRVAADDAALSVLERIRASVPPPVRAASARALRGASPPLALVRLFAHDEAAVGAPVLRDATLTAQEWIGLLPELSPQARAVLRHRRDLGHDVERALAGYGAVDFVLPDPGGVSARVEPATPPPEPAPPLQIPAGTSPFLSLGAIARGLPIVGEALRRRREEPASAEPPALFRIADVVARIEAFQRRQDDAPPLPLFDPVPVAERLRFETDAHGAVRWIDGAPRGAGVGITLARIALPGEAGVDGVAAGAYRKRARFADARLMLQGDGEGAGLWLISAVPSFDGATGRFTGYRGVGRRPRREELPGRGPSADSLRQLVHELRTPTNAIAGFSEMIEHQMLGPAPDVYRAQANAIRIDARGLLAAIDDLDIAARMQAGALTIERADVPLAPIVARTVEDLTPLADLRGAFLTASPADVTVAGDRRAIERLVGRLLATALGAAAKGERISVSTRVRDDQVVLSIGRPAALAGGDATALFALDDEGAPGTLLGAGFALRLVRNLAREMGGMLVIEPQALTLRLPAAGMAAVGQARDG